MYCLQLFHLCMMFNIVRFFSVTLPFHHMDRFDVIIWDLRIETICMQRRAALNCSKEWSLLPFKIFYWRGSWPHPMWQLLSINWNFDYQQSKSSLILYRINLKELRGLISYCWYNPQPMRNDHSIAGTTILQTTLEDADNTQFYW